MLKPSRGLNLAHRHSATAWRPACVIRATARTALVAHARGRGDAAAAGDTDDEVSCGGRLQLSRVEEDGPDKVEGAATHQGDVVLAKWQR
jgi:hypothetical protein